MEYTHYVHFFDGHGHERTPVDSYEEAQQWIDASAKREQEQSDRFREEGFAAEPSQRIWAIQKIGDSEIKIVRNEGSTTEFVEHYIRERKKVAREELRIVVDRSREPEHEVKPHINKY